VNKQSVIRVDQLTKRYGDLSAVDRLTLDVGEGELFGFLGPNGAGKTTTIRIMMGILKASSGRVSLGGHDIEKEPEEAKAITGFVPDRPVIYEKLSGYEFLRFVGQLRRLDDGLLGSRIPATLEQFELTEWRHELVESYSHGMKQRLVLCAALLHRPKILIVDEPMVGMDPKGARKLKDLLRDLARQGNTLFVSTHSIGVAEEICQRVAIIHRGKLIASGTLDELHRQARVREAGLEAAFLELTREERATTEGRIGPDA
jgi:ABC-2 type transport system ATP-binding protein